MSVLDGPGEGTWSVFAQKVVEERDALREKVASLEAELACAKAFHDVAVKERDFYNVRLMHAEAERDTLVHMLSSEFDWSDTSYLHAMMHVENAIRNLRADARAAQAERDQLREELARLHRLAPIGTYTVSLPHEQEIQALRDSRDKWAETARKLGEQLDSSERDAERLSALLDDCRDHIMSQYDPEDSVKLVRRIEEALGLGKPV